MIRVQDTDLLTPDDLAEVVVAFGVVFAVLVDALKANGALPENFDERLRVMPRAMSFIGDPGRPAIQLVEQLVHGILMERAKWEPQIIEGGRHGERPVGPGW